MTTLRSEKSHVRFARYIHQGYAAAEGYAQIGRPTFRLLRRASTQQILHVPMGGLFSVSLEPRMVSVTAVQLRGKSHAEIHANTPHKYTAL